MAAVKRKLVAKKKSASSEDEDEDEEDASSTDDELEEKQLEESNGNKRGTIVIGGKTLASGKKPTKPKAAPKPRAPRKKKPTVVKDDGEEEEEKKEAGEEEEEEAEEEEDGAGPAAPAAAATATKRGSVAVVGIIKAKSAAALAKKPGPLLAQTTRADAKYVLRVPDEYLHGAAYLETRRSWRVGTKVLVFVGGNYLGAQIVGIRYEAAHTAHGSDAYFFDLELLQDRVPGLCPAIRSTRPLFSFHAASGDTLRVYNAGSDLLIKTPATKQSAWHTSLVDMTVAQYDASVRGRTEYVAPVVPLAPGAKKPKALPAKVPSSASAATKMQHIHRLATETVRSKLHVDALPDEWTQLVPPPPPPPTDHNGVRLLAQNKVRNDLDFLWPLYGLFTQHQLVDVCLDGEWLLARVVRLCIDQGISILLCGGVGGGCEVKVAWADVPQRLYPVAYQHQLLDVTDYTERRRLLAAQEPTSLLGYYKHQPAPGAVVVPEQDMVAVEAVEVIDEDGVIVANGAAAPRRQRGGGLHSRTFVGKAKFYVVTDQRYTDGMTKTQLKPWLTCMLPARAHNGADLVSDPAVNSRMIEALNSVKKDHVPDLCITELDPPNAGFTGALEDRLDDFPEESKPIRARFYDKVSAATGKYFQQLAPAAVVDADEGKKKGKGKDKDKDKKKGKETLAPIFMKKKEPIPVEDESDSDSGFDYPSDDEAKERRKKLRAVRLGNIKMPSSLDDLDLGVNVPVLSAASNKRVMACTWCGFKHDPLYAAHWDAYYEDSCPITELVPMRLYEIEWPITMDDFQRMDAQKHDILCGMFPEVAAEYHRVQGDYMFNIPFPLPIEKLQDLSATYHAYKAQEHADYKQQVLLANDEAAAAAAMPLHLRRQYQEAATDVDDLSIDDFSLRCSSELALYDYQVQSVRWMYRKEYDYGSPRLNTLNNVNAPFWSHQTLRDGSDLYYSPFFDKIQAEPLPDIKGGWLCEKMGLGSELKEKETNAHKKPIVSMRDNSERERERLIHFLCCIMCVCVYF